MNFRKIIQFIALGIMLIGFPLGSWYYLNEGYKERKGALDQMRYEIPLPEFQSPSQKGMLSKADLQGGYAVLGKVKRFSKDNPIIRESEGLFEEFGASMKMATVTYVEEYDSSAINNYLASVMKDTLSQWYFISGQPDFDEMFKEKSEQHLALIDTFGVVRNYYDTNNDVEIAEMAKHIAMFVMPLMRRGDLVFKRKEEK
ncbi:MAG: hypothetical protein AAGG68_15225 [Bacteroidota bacterium]